MLPPYCLFDDGGRVMKRLEGMERHHAPLNNWLHDSLQAAAKRTIADDDRYTLIFDKLEILIALNYLAQDANESGWMPPGAFGYRYENALRVCKEIQDSISVHGADSPYVKHRICGDSVQACQQNLNSFIKFSGSLGWSWYWP